MKIKIVITVLLISFLSACSTTKPSVPTGSRKTVGDIMKGQRLGHQNPQSEAFRKGVQSWQASPANLPVNSPNYSAYTRTEAKELNGLFPRLPNPDLCMYVLPHLSSEKATVPGYTSCFSMYDTNQYALPGEMMTTWSVHK